MKTELSWKESVRPTIEIALVPIICCLVFFFSASAGSVLSIIVMIAACVLGMIEWAYLQKRLVTVVCREGGFQLGIFRVIWITGFFVAMVVVWLVPYGVYAVMCATLAIYAGDAAGLIVGKKIKSPKLSQFVAFARYSPRKTVAGTIAYFLTAYVLLFASIIVANAFGILTGEPLKYSVVIVICMPIFGLLGDLNESRLKRLWGTKDSAEYTSWSKLWGRHGGCFDRLDSLTAAVAIPVLFVLAILLALVFIVAYWTAEVFFEKPRSSSKELEEAAV